MASVNFYLDQPYKGGLDRKKINEIKRSGKGLSKILNPQETSIYLILTLPGRTLIKVRTHEKVSGTNWDFDQKLAKRTYNGALELNDFLMFLKREVLKAYRSELTKKEELTIDRIKQLVLAVVQDKLPDMNKLNLQQCIDAFKNEKRLEVKKLTLQKYHSLFVVLEAYYQTENTSLDKIFCESLNRDFEIQFRNYLIEVRGLRNNTSTKYFECLKVFLAWARKLGHNSCNDFEDFKIRREKKDVLFLRRNELDAIINVDLSKKPSLDRVRDLFVFQSFTGQRFSDIINLKYTDLEVDEEGILYWKLYQIKGNKPQSVTIPILPLAQSILTKYSYADERPFVFQRISNVKMNVYLKEVGELAGLTQIKTLVSYSGKKRIETIEPLYKLLTSHMARRNFVSLSIENGLSPEVITKITGHADLRMMRKYLEIHQDTLKSQLFKAWS